MEPYAVSNHRFAAFADATRGGRTQSPGSPTEYEVFSRVRDPTKGNHPPMRVAQGSGRKPDDHVQHGVFASAGGDRMMEPYTVTNHRFAVFVEATGYVTEAERDGWSFVFAGRLPDDFGPTSALASAPWWRAVPGAAWRSPDGPGSFARPDHPVVHVSHVDALAFCAWAGVALPSDSQWETAARAGVESRYPWGDEWDPGRANSFRGDFPHGPAGTVPVDAYEPNELGLHNVVGNVWEWTAERKLRGGSYLCHPSYCNRNQLSGRSDGDAPMGHIGFRALIKGRSLS